MKKTELLLFEHLQSPVGNLLIAESGRGIYAFAFGLPHADFAGRLEGRGRAVSTVWRADPHPVLAQVAGYLAGQNRRFDLQIDFSDLTEFQVQVYRAVLAVPYGETATYGQIAATIGRPRAARAVGAANGANPLPILIPCHRLVGADGGLRGYGGTGGIKTKRWLLDLEKKFKNDPVPDP